MPRGSLLAAFFLALLAPQNACGSFECLPGPALGGLADWAGRTAFPASAPARGWTGSLALGRPAAVEDLGWSHAVARWSGRGASVCLEGFFLALADLYHESVAGVWIGHGGLAAGLRRWQVAWQGLRPRSGWTLSGRAAIRYRQIGLCFSTQDVQLERYDPAAPKPRIGATAALRLYGSLAVEGGIYRAGIDRGLQAGLAWAPISRVTIHQVIRMPSSMLLSGVEFEAGRGSAGIWMEPTPRLGLRIGMSCRLLGRPGGRR